MASILTGLAFMHGHIVDRELVLRLGRLPTHTPSGPGIGHPACLALIGDTHDASSTGTLVPAGCAAGVRR